MPNDMSPKRHRTFDLFGALLGDCRAWGSFEDRAGHVKRTFEATTRGAFSTDTQFILEEVFAFDDGTRERRTWVFDRIQTDRWEGRCDDCVGTADLRVGAHAAVMAYTFRLKLSNRTIDLKFRDRFYAIGDDGLMSRANVTKFGLKVGEVTVFFTPLTSEAGRSSEIEFVDDERADRTFEAVE
ncbi:MAG: DUF3833 family protein [Pseudomonadota bacterium]